MTLFWVVIVLLGLVSIALPWWSKFNWYLVAVLMVSASAIGWYVLSVNVEEVLMHLLPSSDAFAGAAEIMADDAPDGFYWRETLLRYGWIIGGGYASCLFGISWLMQQKLIKPTMD
jgi:hypothetical protein